MGKILGIIGGGQLGMMLTESAKKMPLLSWILLRIALQHK
jgi:phosphoribosylaminoimidazole carboxylase (NCAIR synthetase)